MKPCEGGIVEIIASFRKRDTAQGDYAVGGSGSGIETELSVGEQGNWTRRGGAGVGMQLTENQWVGWVGHYPCLTEP